MYNEKYKILFKFNPIMQCMLGQFFGWQIVLEVFNDCRECKTGDQVKFTYSSGSQFDKLFNYIQKG